MYQIIFKELKQIPGKTSKRSIEKKCLQEIIHDTKHLFKTCQVAKKAGKYYIQ
jgi:hypothetical protein